MLLGRPKLRFMGTCNEVDSCDRESAGWRCRWISALAGIIFVVIWIALERWISGGHEMLGMRAPLSSAPATLRFAFERVSFQNFTWVALLNALLACFAIRL